MLVLGIESSCDETAAALLKNGRAVLSSVVASQDEIHRPYGGVVPELACRSHIQVIDGVVHKALERGGAKPADVDLIAVTSGPGLVGALLVGLSFAKALAFSLKKPLVPVNHLEGHLCSIFLEHPDLSFPFLSLLVSGGHTELVDVAGFGEYRVLGRTRDDAAGEAFDKVAKMLGLGYPGGPIVERISKNGNPESVSFPKSRLKVNPLKGNPLDFSFSGIKTAVKNYLIRHSENEIGNGDITKEDIAASFQNTVIKMLSQQVVLAIEKTHTSQIVLSGGVACNQALRDELIKRGREKGVRVLYPSPKYCTDNAAMIAVAGFETYNRLNGDLSPFGELLEIDADPNLSLG